jgi:hypothetical protein
MLPSVKIGYHKVMAMRLVITGGGEVPHIHSLGDGGGGRGFQSWYGWYGEKNSLASAWKSTPIPCHISHNPVVLSEAIPATKTSGIFLSSCNEVLFLER